MCGYVPARSASLPEINFVFSAVNAGETSEAKSSFQNEIDRYLDLLKRYIDSGCPENGIIFLDEPLAGTSSEDQNAIIVAILDFFKQKHVKLVATNHNHKFFDLLRRTKNQSGNDIAFRPLGFLEGTTGKKFSMEYFDPNDTDAIRSDGIRVAGEMGVPQEIIELAYFVRQKMQQKNP